MVDAQRHQGKVGGNSMSHPMITIESDVWNRYEEEQQRAWCGAVESMVWSSREHGVEQ